MSPWKKLQNLRLALKKAKRRKDEFAIERIRIKIQECKDKIRFELAGQDQNPNPCFE